jgi:hypothetical protein
VTAHLRTLRRSLLELDTDQLPGVWPERIGTHIRSIDANLDTAISNLAGLAYTRPEPDHSRVTTDEDRHHTGDRRASPVEAGARLAIGPQRAIDTIDTELTIGLAHLRPALTPGIGSHTHDRCRLANEHLGKARSLIEKHAGITYRPALLRCACGGMDGHLEWGNQLCDNVAAPDLAGLCIQCARKRDAWRKRRDYRQHGRRDRQAGAPA